MKYGEITLGQIEALVNRLGGEQIVHGILTGTIKVVTEAARRLRLVGTVWSPKRSERFDPKTYYVTRSGLYVWDSFRDLILPAAKLVDSIPDQSLLSYELEQPANDAENRAELPEGHVFADTSEFCARLAGMIDAQKNGDEGALLANGYANLFYVRVLNSEVFAVSVYWFAGIREWIVCADRLGDYRWHVGYRVFSSTAAA